MTQPYIPGFLAFREAPHLVDLVTTQVQYSAVQYSTVQYSTVQYSAVQYSTVPPGHLAEAGAARADALGTGGGR